MLCQHLLTWKSFYSNILFKSCSNLTQILLKFIYFINIYWLENLLTQILLRSCSDLFALSILVDLRIFLLKYLSKIFEQNLSWVKYLSKKCILLLVFCFLYHASYLRCNHINMCILLWVTHSHCVICIHNVISLVIMMILFFQVEW